MFMFSGNLTGEGCWSYGKWA